jgi:hypothetical protein
MFSKGKGVNKTISISKIIKMIPSKKNRSENGIRAVFLGSNPHSNGDDFSRSLSERELRIQAAIKVAKARADAMNDDTIIEIII